MLETYAKKRNFDKTSEPSGKEKARGKGALTFVIQKHSASRLHYDFRLECGGALLSWAVPKGPSLDPAVKRLAVMVEDHPLAYGGFEGLIPKGQYGAGEVIIWDRGSYCPEKALETNASRKAQENQIKDGLRKGKLSFTLFGKKLHGSWTLIKIRHSEKDWLLIKHTDKFVDTEHDVTDQGESVLSKKTIAGLQGSNPDRPHKPEPDVKDGTNAVKKKSMAVSPKRRPAGLADLADIKPMLASLSAKPFSKSGWIYEPKFDGIRAIAYIRDNQVTLKSRGGLDLNHRFPDLVKALTKSKDIVVDGEIVALDDQGRPSFQLLQSRATAAKTPARAKRIVYYVFDMLAEAGSSLAEDPLKLRKARLKKKLSTSQNIKFVDDLHCDGQTAFDLCIKQGLEGIVAKRLGSPYKPGKRSPDWIKVKGTQSSEFVICGYTQGTGSRQKTFGSLLLGYYKNKELHYAGGVGTGFDQNLIKLILGKLKPIIRKTCPFTEPVKDKGNPVWVQAKLVAEIKYGQWTESGKLRAPVFLRLRDDVTVQDTEPGKDIAPPVSNFAKTRSAQKALSPKKTMTNPKTTSPAKAKVKPEKSDDSDQNSALAELLASKGDILKIVVDGHALSFTHLDKVLWPGKNGKGLTKRDYANYLLTTAPYILPHLKDRPLTLVRFPNGVNGQRFFQKHWDQTLPPFVETVEHFAEHSQANHRFLLCNNLATLLWLAQIADLELHTSHARIGKAAENKSLTQTYTDSVARIERSTLNYPDYIVLDLDPYIYSGKEAKGEEPALNRKGFRKVCELALDLKKMLDDLGADSFVKTSGRTGLHIYIPIVRNIDFDQVRAAAETIGKHLLEAHAKDVTMDWAVVKRTGKVFFDHNMNARTKTLASIYSPRMSQIGTISVPVDWDELSSIYPEQFTLKTVPARLARLGDLWKDILNHRADLKVLLA